MARSATISPAIRARIIHGALVLGIVLFWMLAWALRDRSLPAEALPDRRVLYIALALVSAALFGAAAFSVARLAPPVRGAEDMVNPNWAKEPRHASVSASRSQT